MPAWLIQLLEALALAIASGLGTYGASHDMLAGIAAGAAMFAGKLVPSQVIGTTPAQSA